ncbi:MAG: glycosyltransferase [Polyangiaceae bacterium]|nr:glycosyltransferase [Polyangiaceae bacterium]
MTELQRVVLVVAMIASAVDLLGVLAVLRLLRKKTRRAKGPAPLVSILKPLCGCDDQLADNLRSFFRQDYPHYELLFGMASPEDPALPVVEQVIREFPGFPAKVVLTDPLAATNPKVAQLLGLERHAAGKILVISDANVRAPNDYLSDLVRVLQRKNTGIATNLFYARNAKTVGAALDQLCLLRGVLPYVAISALFTRPLVIGKSMALWRATLQRIGGFRAFGDYLAEDYCMAEATSSLGRKIRLARVVLETPNAHGSFESSMARHTRWGIMRRVIAPGAFFSEFATHTFMLWGLVGILSARWAGLWMAALLETALVASLSIAMRQRAGRSLLDRDEKASPLDRWQTYASLVVATALRPFVAVTIWCTAALRSSVTWRGNVRRVTRKSLLVPVRQLA